jgi:hypothetical protein
MTDPGCPRKSYKVELKEAKKGVLDQSVRRTEKSCSMKRKDLHTYLLCYMRPTKGMDSAGS